MELQTKHIVYYSDPFTAILVISLEFLLYSLAGPLPSALIFLFTQLYIVSGTLFIGTLNVSALLQVSFITNQGWVQASLIITSTK